MLGLSIDTVNDWANRLYIVFTVIAIGGAALALIASFFMWRTGAILSRISDEKIAALQSSAENAKLEQEKLHTSNLQLQQDVERERTARLLIEKDVGTIKPQVQSLLPPKLTEDQISILISELSSHPGNKVKLSLDMGAPGMRGLTDQLIKAFGAAHWEILSGQVMGLGRVPASGLLVRGNKEGLSNAQAIVVAALQKAAIKFDQVLDRIPFNTPVVGHYAMPGGEPDTADITITSPQH